MSLKWNQWTYFKKILRQETKSQFCTFTHFAPPPRIFIGVRRRRMPHYLLSIKRCILVEYFYALYLDFSFLKIKHFYLGLMALLKYKIKATYGRYKNTPSIKLLFYTIRRTHVYKYRKERDLSFFNFKTLLSPNHLPMAVMCSEF